VAFETFGSGVNIRHHRVQIHVAVIVVRQQTHQRRVDPSTSRNRVQTANHNVKLLVKPETKQMRTFGAFSFNFLLFRLVLHLAEKGMHLHSSNAFVDKIGRSFGFGLAHVRSAKQELTIEIGGVNCVLLFEHNNHQQGNRRKKKKKKKTQTMSTT
jgi:hypothetical protein